jgi:hypothetical protein
LKDFLAACERFNAMLNKPVRSTLFRSISLALPLFAGIFGSSDSAGADATFHWVPTDPTDETSGTLTVPEAGLGSHDLLVAPTGDWTDPFGNTWIPFVEANTIAPDFSYTVFSDNINNIIDRVLQEEDNWWTKSVFVVHQKGAGKTTDALGLGLDVKYHFHNGKWILDTTFTTDPGDGGDGRGEGSTGVPDGGSTAGLLALILAPLIARSAV